MPDEPSAVLDRVTSIILILLNVIACSDFLFHHLVFLVFQNKNYINSFFYFLLEKCHFPIDQQF